ncbi:MAG: TonB family protein [Prevotella sp.]|nr:TonB family protein [Prevotella sp.]
MMLDFLIYDLKVAVLIAVFYMFYRLLLSKETFHRVNRVVLLATAVLSFVLPLCVITMHETVTIQAVPEVTIGDVQVAVEEEPATLWWQIMLPILYMIGMVATLGHTLLSIWKVMLLIRRSEQHLEPDGTTVCVTGNAAVAPFSWMHYIVMNRADYEAHDAAILTHERGHIRMRHSYDVVLVDLLTALQWFNPAMWMLRQDLRAIHEYEADGEVLSQGINARQYQYLLISKAASIGGYSIANGISHSTLKNRIHMMTNKKTRSSHLLKLLALVPILGVALALNARTVTDYVYDEPQKKIIKKGKKAGTINPGTMNEIVVVEQAPKVESTTEDNETFTFRGKVYDDEGKPVVGAVILIDGSKKGSVSDVNGAFTIKAKMGDYLNISYVGLETVRLGVSKMFAKEHEYIISMNKENAGGNKPFDVVEQMPQFPGGPAALMEFLSKNIKYPEEAYKNGIQGRVIVTFTVNKDGSISEAKVVKSVDPQLDEEALRVAYSMPNWNPGMQNGEPVNVKYTVPITFKLQGDAGSATEKIIIGKEHKGKDFSLIIDGKVVDVTELSGISPDNIESMKVEKTKDDTSKDRLIITLKKKKQ